MPNSKGRSLSEVPQADVTVSNILESTAEEKETTKTSIAYDLSPCLLSHRLTSPSQLSICSPQDSLGLSDRERAQVLALDGNIAAQLFKLTGGEIERIDEDYSFDIGFPSVSRSWARKCRAARVKMPGRQA
jgi:hypothetical protein